MKPIRTLSAVLAIGMLISAVAGVGAQEGRRVALVIGNSAYTGVFPVLKNPANDARDVAAALEKLGFKVDPLVDATRKQMNQAIMAFREELAADRRSEGFFYFAGHGVQAKGVNYLIPVGADIRAEVDLEDEAVSLQRVLASVEEAQNRVNVIVLDACRDNPLPASVRSAGTTRGLAVVSRTPPQSVVLYSTGSDQTASDGSGRNSPFAQALLRYLPGATDISRTIKLVTAEVKRLTDGIQTPFQYSSLDFDYSLSRTASAPVITPIPSITLTRTYGSLVVTTATGGTLYVDGAAVGDLPAGEVRLDNIPTGSRSLELRYATGDKETRAVTVPSGTETRVAFTWTKPAPAPVTITPVRPAPTPDPPPVAAATPAKPATSSAPTAPVTEGRFVRLPGGTFTMGSPSTEQDRWDDEGPQHQVTVSAFSIGAYEVTMGEFRAFVTATGHRTTAELEGGGYVYSEGSWVQKADASWKNPYFTQTDASPVVLVSWNDAVEYCNWRSRQEGLRPAYTISSTSVRWDRTANGYRLPTEAEWEYACRAGTTTAFSFGDSLAATQANFDGNYQYKVSGKGTYLERTQTVGSYTANRWGIFDMHGNVWEWCWDWYDFGYYAKSPAVDPAGASSGDYRVGRGGSWIIHGRYLRSADRVIISPGSRDDYLGFRLVRP